MSDCELAQIRHSVYHVSAVERPDQYKVKEEVLNHDGQSSEEEMEEDCAESQNHSILPSSVLDKASVIAEHFIANTRRSSAAPDELQSPHRIQQEVTSSKITAANSTLLSPREEMSGSDRHVCRRRDSTLSKTEQLLINKIRNYYENAEQNDVGFSLKRRESLTYIPSGLVRTSVSRFNKNPHTAQTKPPNTETALMASSPASSDITKPAELRDVFITEVHGSARHKSEEVPEGGFRSSAEMIKVWQEMEKEVTSSLRENQFRDFSRVRGTHSVSQSRRREGQVGELFTIEDLNTITEESPVKVMHCDSCYTLISYSRTVC